MKGPAAALEESKSLSPKHGFVGIRSVWAVKLSHNVVLPRSAVAPMREGRWDRWMLPEPASAVWAITTLKGGPLLLPLITVVHLCANSTTPVLKTLVLG
jgi:hypothetical protein